MNDFDYIKGDIKHLLNIFLNEYCKLFNINKDKSLKYIKSNKIFNKLTEKWYDLESINLNEAYKVYSHKYYFTDMFNCYKYYSKRYINILYNKPINGITFVNQYKNEINGILDIGCGCGFTCLHLKQVFKGSKVYGVNLPNTNQYNFCKTLNFELCSDYNNINSKIDLIFASEFFEHIKKPIELIDNLIKKFNPKFIITANAFNTRSIGHFSNYIVNGKVISQKKISRMFNKFVKDSGYIKLKTNYYNSRPYIWIKK